MLPVYTTRHSSLLPSFCPWLTSQPYSRYWHKLPWPFNNLDETLVTSETLVKPLIKPQTLSSSSILKSFTSLMLMTVSNWGHQQDFVIWNLSTSKVSEGTTCCASVCASLALLLHLHRHLHRLPKGLWRSVPLFMSKAFPFLAHYPVISDHVFNHLQDWLTKVLHSFAKLFFHPPPSWWHNHNSQTVPPTLSSASHPVLLGTEKSQSW